MRTGTSLRDQLDAQDVKDLAGRDSSLHEAAMERLYRHYAVPLRAFAYRFLTDEDATDVAQEVLLTAWRRANDYQPLRGSVRAWLVSMTRSRAFDVLRARHAKKRQAVTDAAVLVTTDMREVGEPDYALLRAAIMLLPDAQRTLIDLAYFDGLSHTEIASETRLPLGTVKTRLRTAVQNLRLAVPAESVEAMTVRRRARQFASLDARILGHLADIYFIDEVDARRVQRTKWGHVDPRAGESLTDLWRFVPPASVTSHPVRRVLDSGRPEYVPHASSRWLSDVAWSADHLAYMQWLGVRSVISHAIYGDSGLIGALTLVRVDASGVHYKDGDIREAATIASALGRTI